MDKRRFELPVAVGLSLQSRSGKVRVIAEPRDDVEAEGDRLNVSGGEGGEPLQIRAGMGTGALTVRCPAGTDINVGTHSGSVRLEGRFGEVSVTTMSGNIEIESADAVDSRTMSGSIRVGACAGRCRASTVAGKLAIGRAGSASVSTMSGSVSIDEVAGALKARSVSGSIVAACGCEGPIAVKTVSGKVHLGLPEGTAPDACFKTMGHVECGFPAGDDVHIEAMSISGTIEVVPE
ncbi:MAG TPA: DUF4097 family beta strand repeat-containing protein [Dehalococcoidia bacterium]|nr:DUF4097 family beta strand repeat-containing protein [Dehalococcoidia bacterium]